MAEKRVSWAELFFDLVFVYAVTRISLLLGTDHSALGLLRGLIAFVPVYWLWVGTAIQTNHRDVARPVLRIALFAVALVALFMALALPEVFAESALLFAVAYWIGRFVLAAVSVSGPGHPVVSPYLVSVVATGPLLVVGALLSPGPRTVVWALAALIDLATPWLLRSRMASIHFDAAHLAERFGLFVLIALGESVVVIGESADEHGLDLASGVAVAGAFVLACALWWVYFHFAADAVRHALATAEVQLDITRTVLSYGHLSFIAAIVLVAVGLHEAVARPTEHVGYLLGAGVALYLLTFGYTRWRMFRLVSKTRVTAGVAALLVTLGLPLMPALAGVALLAAVVIALNVYEWLTNDRISWRARLRER
ncbi:low temperature requirement protein A [Cryptosporangium phraense]|uniref:Low temperature requirement protein A n=1 Tax=Cryptosporangium phraense TaxID=2593070 RepID=A0A545B0P4_9ACTN|nr:low temperature requirement protein A [Cryptosporangium phraense]